MPSAPWRSKRPFLARSAGLCILLTVLSGCKQRTPPEPSSSGSAQRQTRAQPGPSSASAAKQRVRRPAPTGPLDCKELRPVPETERDVGAELIELRPLGPGKKVFTSKLGVVVTFDREEFLQAAKCLKFEKAIRYVEEETGKLEESPIMDAFQLSYVAAALLDVGRASVRLEEEHAPRKWIVRDGWAFNACAGRCRSSGRLYRVSDDVPAFFLRVTDHNRDL